MSKMVQKAVREQNYSLGKRTGSEIDGQRIVLELRMGDMKLSKSGIRAKRHVSGEVEGRSTKSGDKKMCFAIRSALNLPDYVAT